LQVAIVEDDLIFRKELLKILSAFPGIEIIGSFDNGEELLAQVHRIKPDILFLDVGLPGISGIQVAESVRRDFPYLDIVFITADENHFRDAFQVYATDYIDKPLDTDRVYKTIARIQNKFPRSESKIELRCKETVEILRQEEIYMVEALSKKTVVNSVNHSFTCLYSIQEMEDRLDKELFLRTSRSYIVNLRLVESIKSSMRALYQISFKGRDYQAFLQKDIYPEFRRRIKGQSIV